MVDPGIKIFQIPFPLHDFDCVNLSYFTIHGRPVFLFVRAGLLLGQTKAKNFHYLLSRGNFLLLFVTTQVLKGKKENKKIGL